jgi:cellulose synthase/poly-beta-1,6-N-acetylglucosamine synthase-like glycosyltransferase
MTTGENPLMSQSVASSPPADLPESAPLAEHLSARELLGAGQRIALGTFVAVVAGLVVFRLATGLGPSIVTLVGAFVAVSTVIYIAVLTFRVMVVFAAGSADVMSFDADDLRAVTTAGVPRYTVLVPLYREGKVLPTLVEKLSRLRYPKDRLQILLLIEEDDDQTRAALATTTLPRFFEVVLVPPSQPRTKPKACNYGLTLARGEYCVIYDAEDRPDVDQLLKAVSAFRRLPRSVVCVQAELQYWNPETNWLTRCFAAEYAVNFSLWLRGLDRFRLPIPLGGTSNHFRTDALRQLGAWDPHNVTEDADLGIRIARRGWGARMMNSVTEEEANSKVGNWIRQRSRWIKGFYQTYLVHMRSPIQLCRELGTRRFVAFQLIMGLSTLTSLLNPIFWTLTLVYVVDGPDRIAPLFPPVVLALGVVAMLAGNLLMVFTLMIGCMERGLYSTVSKMLTVPVYWALLSIAAYKAFSQVLRPSKRHYWELTEHGLVDEAPSRDLLPVPGAGTAVVPAQGRAAAVHLTPATESSSA